MNTKIEFLKLANCLDIINEIEHIKSFENCKFLSFEVKNKFEVLILKKPSNIRTSTDTEAHQHNE